MKINDFAKLLAEMEGKKKQVDIAQIKEILRCVNKALYGKLYSLIKGY